MILEDTADPILTTGMQHTALFLGIIVSFFAIVAGIRAWRKDRKEMIAAREEAVIARSKQEELLVDIAKEFKPNHGSSLVDRVNAIGESVNDHHDKADKWFRENAEAHDKIHRRIDGMYDLIVGGTCNSPRKTADRHHNREEQS